MRNKCIVSIFVGMCVLLPTLLFAHPYTDAKAYFSLKQYDRAITLFAESKATEPLLADYADYYIAYSYYMEKQYAQAIPRFSAVIKDYPSSVWQEHASYYYYLSQYKLSGISAMSTWNLMKLADAAWKQKEYDQAGHLWFWLLSNRSKTVPTGKIVEKLIAYEQQKRIYHTRRSFLGQLVRRNDAQSKHILALMNQYARKPSVSYAPSPESRLYSRGLTAYLDRNQGVAKACFTEIVSAYPSTDYRPAAMYWLGKLSERNGNPAQGAEMYKKIVDQYPHYYFGFRAAQRLGVEPPTLPLAEVPPKYARLNELGCYDDAGREISARVRRDRDNTYFVLPFWSDIVSHSARYGLDPYFATAVMREESRFNPVAISRSGALGLMQIMPRTGTALAQRTGLEHFSLKNLLTPLVSIQLGTNYLGEMQKRHNGDPKMFIHMLSSYNAGPTAMARFRKHGGDAIADEDEFVERIPYAETRYYIKKVMRSYWVYKANAAENANFKF